MLINLLLVGLGGATGSMLRYYVQRAVNGSFPFGTLSVNIIGCLLIGLLWGILSKDAETKRLLLMTGFCGGFTTFSAFTQEGIEMLLSERWLLFGCYVGASVAAGLLATFLGYKMTN